MTAYLRPHPFASQLSGHHPFAWFPVDKDYLRALPPLRFLGALFLVLFHLHAYGYMDVPNPLLARLVSKGYIGTSLFFIISGFVMTHLYARTTALSPATFYWKRLTRILPPYYLGLLLGIPVVLFGASAHPQLGTFLGQLTLYLFGLQSWVFGQSFVFNVPGWSVSVLIFFYLLFPLLRSWLVKLSPPVVIRTLVLLWLVCLIPPMVFMLFTTGPTTDNDSLSLNFLKTFPLFRLPELMLGMLAALLYQQRSWQRVLAHPVTLWVCFGVLLSIMLLVPEPNTAYPLFHNGLLTPLIMVCVLSLAYHEGVLASLGNRRWIQSLGNTSLNIFLLHVPLFNYYRRTLRGDQDHWNAGQVLVYLALLIGLSLAVEAFVTAPLMRRLRASNWLLRFSKGTPEARPLPFTGRDVVHHEVDGRS